MYGENEVNGYHIIKYGLLYDFFKSFSTITFRGYPLAQCLSVHFLKFIHTYVDENVNNEELIRHIMSQKQFKSMGDINSKLLAFDQISVSPFEKDERVILMSDYYYKFAVDQLQEHHVVFFGTEHKRGFLTHLPKNFQSISFREQLKMGNTLEIKESIEEVKLSITTKLETNQENPLFLTNEFREWLLKNCISFIKWTSMIDQVVINTKPSIIMVPSEQSLFGSILGFASKKYNIPFVLIPITTIGDRSIIPSRADHFFVWGNYQKNWLQERLIEEEKIAVTGNLKFYYEQQKEVQTKSEFCFALKIPDQHYLIGFTSQPFDINHELEKWICEIPEGWPVTIIVKRHKSDHYEYPLLQRKQNVRILEKSYPLYSFLHCIDSLMTIASTTAFEALLLNKTLIVLQPQIPYHYVLSNNQNNSFFAQQKAGAVIHSSEELLHTVEKLLTNTSFQEELFKAKDQFLLNHVHTVNKTPTLVKGKLKEIIYKEQK